MKKRFYFTEIKEFAQWYKDQNKINMTIEAMLEEPFLSRLYVRMEEENIRRKENQSKTAKANKLGSKGHRNKKGVQFSDEHKQKMSDARKGKAPANKGVACKEETKKKISDKVKSQGGFGGTNKIYVKCPDGKITTKPSSVLYCRNRGLNPNDCVIIDINSNETLS